MESQKLSLIKNKNQCKRQRLFAVGVTKKDRDYGANCEKPDMEPEDFEQAKSDFINKSLNKNTSELEELENRTRDQADSSE